MEDDESNFIGKTTLAIKTILQAKADTTQRNVRKTIKQWMPIENEGRKVGSIHIDVTLEDLGIKEEFTKNNAMNTNIGLGQTPNNMSMGIPNNLNSVAYNNSPMSNINYNARDPKGIAFPTTLPMDPNQQILWELELWKKAEEAKFLATLRKREQDHLEDVADKFRARESVRASAFTKATHELSAIENKMRTKISEMQKREAQIEALETTLGTKIEESVKNIAAKDQEVFNIRKELQVVRAQLERPK